jgi:putative (di)nucleoside polyphosphate hydrolase
MATGENGYRRGVGVMLLNRDGKVFVGARIDNTDEAWQMPQGGIDKGEQPWATALRELEEETGIAPHLVERIAECPERLKYDLPEELRGKLWGGKWKGQDQDWFLARFLGTDADVNIATEHPEFREWQWIEADRLPELIVPFKRDLYRRLLREFAEHL